MEEENEVTSQVEEIESQSEEPAEEIESTENVAPEPAHEDKVQKRIDKAIYEKHQARREAEQVRAENEALRKQLMEGKADVNPESIGELVRQEAVRLQAEERYNDACNRTYNDGVKEFGTDFDKAMSNLALVGMTRDFLELVSESEHGSRILAHLGNDLDEAERISALSPVKMARELTKLDIALGTKKPKAVSKVPEPITPIKGVSGGHKSPGDMTDAEYMKWRRSK